MKKQLLVSAFAVAMMFVHTYEVFTIDKGTGLVYLDIFLILAWGYIIYLYNKD